MPTLENILGSSVVPNIGPALGILRQNTLDKERRDEQARVQGLEEQKVVDIQDAFDLLETGGEENEQIALSRIASLQGPAVANSIRQSLERGDKNELSQIEQESTKALQVATFFGGIKDPNKLNTAIKAEANRAAANGEDISKLVELINATPEKQQMLIEKQRITSIDAAELAKERLAKIKFQQELQKQAQAPVTLSPGQQRLIPGQAEPVAQVAPKPEAQTTLVRNLQAAGVDLSTPAGQAKLLQAINKPTTKVDINTANQGLFKTPEGFMLLNPNDPTQGVTPIPGGPKDNKTGEQAAKIQMLRTAKKAFKGVEDLVFDKDGEVNDLTLIAAAINAPGTDGRVLRSRMEFGIQAITRGETGAAMPPEEVENTRTRFMPSPLDSKEIVRLKLDLFNDFLNGTIKLIDPSGTFNAVRFQTELDKRSGKKKTDKKTADFSTMSDEELLKGF